MWMRKDLTSGDPLEFLEMLGELTATKGWKWFAKIIEDEVRSRTLKAGSLGVDGSPAQVIKHNQTVFTAQGLREAMSLVEDARKAASDVIRNSQKEKA